MPADPLLPLRFLLLVSPGLVNREQAKVVDYLREENRVLREQLGKRRLRRRDEQRARLATRAAALGRSLLESIATIVTPDTFAALAPTAGRGEVDTARAGESRPAAGDGEDPRTDHQDGHRQPWLGLHTHRRRTRPSL